MILRQPAVGWGRGRPAQGITAGNYRVAIWGQSNAIGRADRADIAASPLSSDAGLAAFDAGTFGRVYIGGGAGGYSQLQPSTNNGADTGQFGPEFGMAVRWMRETTSGNLYIEKEAGSGWPISMFADPFYYGQMKNRHTQGTAWLATNSIPLVSDMWLWVQGESDSGASQSSYQTALTDLMTTRQTDSLMPAGSQQTLAQMGLTSGAYGAGVAAAKTAIADASGGNITTIGMNYYKPADNLHIGGRGQVQLGYDAFEKLFNVNHLST